jgi:hypothetical protein
MNKLDWSYPEPDEGKFNRELADSIINRWSRWGNTISFRITCNETDLIFFHPYRIIFAYLCSYKLIFK